MENNLREAEQIRQKLKEANARLQIEQASLTASSHIVQRAKKLGLRVPEPWQLVIIEVGQKSDF